MHHPRLRYEFHGDVDPAGTRLESVAVKDEDAVVMAITGEASDGWDKYTMPIS